MKVIINGSDLIIIPFVIYLGVINSHWWWLLAPLIVTGWFINPRWSRSEGWRVKHD